MLKLYDTVHMAGCYLPALINDDWTGLDLDEEADLQDWLTTCPKAATFDVVGEEPDFRHCDVSGLMADCFEVNIWAEEKTYRVISIDAWRDGSGWSWNQWFNCQPRFPADLLDASSRAIFRWFRENGMLSSQSAGRVAIEDDQYNLVIVERHSREPLFAIEYGSEE